MENANLPPETPQDALRGILRDLRAVLERQAATGVRAIPRAGEMPLPAPSTAAAEPSAPPGRETPTLSRAEALQALRAEIGDCTRCPLHPGRTNLVFGVGNPDAELMFVGEGPGAEEDRRGEPFVGRAGQLLTDIIQKGMKLRREDVYIANVVKCRPPGNRNPEFEEIATCLPFLRQQIRIVEPRVIVALGKFAAQELLGVTTSIMRMRGVWHEVEGIRVMPTLHPAYVLRNPASKRDVWQDIQKVMAELGIA